MAHESHCCVGDPFPESADRAPPRSDGRGGLDPKLAKQLVPWDDQWYAVKLVRDVASGRISVSFDDLETPLMETTDPTFTAGRVGIGSFDDMNDFTDEKVSGRKAEATP